MTQNHNVSVSMNQAAAVKTGMVFKQGDFGFNLVITVLDFDVTGTTPQIVFRKPMGAVESTTITVSGNTYTYAMKGTELDTPGKVFCDLKLKNSTTQRISSASFMFEVVADTLDGLNEQASSYSDTIAQIVGGFDDDISYLKGATKSDGTAINSISTVATIPFEKGYVGVDSNGFVYSNHSKRVRTPQGFTIHLKAGDRIGLTDYSGKRFSPSRYDSTTNTYITSGWITSEFVVEDSTEGDYVFMLAYDPDATVTDVSALSLLFYCNLSTTAIPKLQHDVTLIQTLDGIQSIPFEKGYVSADSSGFVYSAHSKRVRTPEDFTIHLKAGDRIGLTNYTGKRFSPSRYDDATNTYITSGWLTSEYVVDENSEGNYVFMLAYDPDATITSVTNLSSLFYCKLATDEICKIENNIKFIKKLDKIENIPFERGYASVDNSGFVYSTHAQRARTPQGFTMHLKSGDRIGLTDYTGKRFSPSRYDYTTHTYISAVWLKNEFVVEDNTEGDYVFMIAYDPDATLTDVSDLSSLFYCKLLERENQSKDEKDGNINPEFEKGYVGVDSNGFVYSSHSQRVRTKEGITYHLKQGMVIGLTDYTGKRFTGSYKKANGTYESLPWNTSDFIIETEGDYVFMLAYNPDAAVTNPGLLSSYFFCKTNNNPVKMDLIIYNIGHFAYGGGQIVDDHFVYKYGIYPSIYDDRLKNYKDFFCEQRAGLVIITEYSRCLDRVEFGDSDADGLINTKETLFDPLYPYSVFVDYTPGKFLNNGIFSDHMLIDKKAIGIGDNTQVPGSLNSSTFCHMKIGDKNVAVWCVHLGVDPDGAAKRAEQIKSIIAGLANEEYAIVVGDFNTAEGSSEYTRFVEAGYTVANTGAYFGDCDTWDSEVAYQSNLNEAGAVAWDDYATPSNSVPLDNIITTPNIKVQRFKVLYDWYEKLTSDHPPVVATIMIN